MVMIEKTRSSSLEETAQTSRPPPTVSMADGIPVGSVPSSATASAAVPSTPAQGFHDQQKALAVQGQPSPEPGVARIKRNSACVSCRDAKVKCNPGQGPIQQCLRCARLELVCIVDKSHKRTSRRSKLDQLAAEIRDIKAAVDPKSNKDPCEAANPTTPSQHLLDLDYRLPSLRFNPQLSATIAESRPLRKLMPQPGRFSNAHTFDGPSEASPSGISSASTSASPMTVAVQDGSQRTGQLPHARALGSRVFSGDDVDYYFCMYFEHFHPYFPLVRIRDPDMCYERGPVLFWAIIVTACRRFARDASVFQFLADAIPPQIWSAVSQPPLRLNVINAVLLVAAWPLPHIRFLADPCLIYAGIAVNASFLLGLHTGRGSHNEFHGRCHADCRTTDEEATYTWAACNIVSNRVASYMGCPTASFLFNHTIDEILAGSAKITASRYFTIQLETSRFSSHVSRTMSASLEEANGVSHHTVKLLEDEFSKFQMLLYPENTDLDNFTILSSLLEIQVYYFMPLPNCPEPTTQRNLLRCYTTAESLIRQAVLLNAHTAFLHHAPHSTFRSLLSATCVVISVLFSPLGKALTAEPVDELVRDAIRVMRACSVQDGDLHMRAANMLERYWENREHLPRGRGEGEGTVSGFTHRLGASLAFECLRRWKREVERARKLACELRDGTAGVVSEMNEHEQGQEQQQQQQQQQKQKHQRQSTPPPQQQQQQRGEAMDGISAAPAANIDLVLMDPTQQVDWTAFMDDFDWSFTSSHDVS